MNFYDENAVRGELRELLGRNCEPTRDLMELLLKAYELGRKEAAADLGFGPEDANASPDYIAWTA